MLTLRLTTWWVHLKFGIEVISEVQAQTWWRFAFLRYQWTVIVFPPSSSSKLTCSGWWTSPTKCARNIRLSVRLSDMCNCVYECSEDRITPVRSARLNKVSTYPGIVRHTLTRSLLAIAVELVSVVVDSPDDAHPFLATRIVAIPWKEHLTARVNSKLLMLVHTFSNQKSTSGWALLNISVSLSLYGKFVGCQIRLFDLPHEYTASVPKRMQL